MRYNKSQNWEKATELRNTEKQRKSISSVKSIILTALKKNLKSNIELSTRVKDKLRFNLEMRKENPKHKDYLLADYNHLAKIQNDLKREVKEIMRQIDSM